MAASHELPARANLEHLRNEAKQRLKELRGQDPAARLADAQLAVARDYGFASWRKLKSYVEMIHHYRQPDPKSDDDANKFLRLACITYFDGDHPSRHARARQLLAEKPHLAKANIYTAAVVGDFAAMTDFLTKHIDVNAKGGPFHWEPLLYAAYSRLDSEAEGHCLGSVVGAGMLEA